MTTPVTLSAPTEGGGPAPIGWDGSTLRAMLDESERLFACDDWR